MNKWILRVSNFSAFLFITLIATSLQTSFWPHLFGSFPPPQIWLSILCYWSIFRHPKATIIMVYLVTLVISPFTVMPMSFLLVIHLLIALTIYIFRQRIYWNGPTYYMLICAMATMLFPFYHLILSWGFESNSITNFEFFEWIIRPLLTALIALPVYFLYTFIDDLTQMEMPTEVGKQRL